MPIVETIEFLPTGTLFAYDPNPFQNANGT